MSLAPKLYFETTDSVSRESRYFRYIVVITVVVCKCNVINLDVIEAIEHHANKTIAQLATILAAS